MARLRVKFHPLFVLFAFFLVYFGQGLLFVSYFLTIFLHELSHAYVAKILGYRTKQITLIPFGICLNLDDNNLRPDDERKIALAGPLSNLLLSFVMFALWWLFPETYNVTYLFGYSNIVTCLFNLLPAFPLDGGRVVRAMLINKYNKKISKRVCISINLFVILLLISLFVFSCFYRINFTYLLVVVCVASGLKGTDDNYSFLTYEDKKNKKRILKIKNLYIDENEQLYKVCRHLDNFTFVNLYVYDKNENLIDIIGEIEFYSLLQNFSATDTFSFCLKH